jgi:hypothetical protein
MKAGGRIYLVEKVVGPANERDGAKWDDLNMLVMTGGRERTVGEFGGLLKEAGFGVVRERHGVIEAEAMAQ